MANNLTRKRHMLHNNDGRVSLTRLVVLTSMVNLNCWTCALMVRTLMLDDMNFSMALSSAAMILGAIGTTAAALHELTKWLEGRQRTESAEDPPERMDQCD